MSRRQTIKDTPRVYRELDKTPIEIPAGTRTIPDTKEMVRQYVNQALAQAGGVDEHGSVEELLRHELDLDPMDPEPPFTSQYEVQEMQEEVIAPRNTAPSNVEGEQDPSPSLD